MELKHDWTLQAGAGGVVSFVPPENMRVKFIWIETAHPAELETIEVRDVTVMNRSQITDANGKPVTMTAAVLSGNVGLRFDPVPATGRFDLRMYNVGLRATQMIVRLTGTPFRSIATWAK